MRSMRQKAKKNLIWRGMQATSIFFYQKSLNAIMSKQISSADLGEIIFGLLVAPNEMSELDLLDSHNTFVSRAGELVAEFCGGETGSADSDFAETLLTVHQNDSLPDSWGVWGAFDLEGDEVNTGDMPKHIKQRLAIADLLEKHAAKIREEMAGLVFEK